MIIRIKDFFFDEANLDGVAIAGEADVDKSLVRLQILQRTHYVGVKAWIESINPKLAGNLVTASFIWFLKLHREFWLNGLDKTQRLFDRWLSYQLSLA